MIVCHNKLSFLHENDAGAFFIAQKSLFFYLLDYEKQVKYALLIRIHIVCRNFCSGDGEEDVGEEG